MTTPDTGEESPASTTSDANEDQEETTVRRIMEAVDAATDRLMPAIAVVAGKTSPPELAYALIQSAAVIYIGDQLKNTEEPSREDFLEYTRILYDRALRTVKRVVSQWDEDADDEEND